MSKAQSNSPNTHFRKIWFNEKIEGNPEARIINLAYDDVLKVLLSFSVDLTLSNNNYLDPSRGIKINGETIKIPDLPRDPHSLSYIEKEDIDVTEYLKISPEGKDNRIEVFFRLGQKGWLLKRVEYGTISLNLTVHLPQKVEKITQSSIKFIYCIFCRREIPDYSKYCLHCGKKQEGVGREIKKCATVNCGEMLPDIALYCKKCASAQPK